LSHLGLVGFLVLDQLADSHFDPPGIDSEPFKSYTGARVYGETRFLGRAKRWGVKKNPASEGITGTSGAAETVAPEKDEIRAVPPGGRQASSRLRGKNDVVFAGAAEV